MFSYKYKTLINIFKNNLQNKRILKYSKRNFGFSPNPPEPNNSRNGFKIFIIYLIYKNIEDTYS
jgi:hypothetical protein